MAKIYYDVDYSELEKLETAIKNYPGNAESKINSYLEETGGNTIIKDMTQFIPVSNPSRKDGIHAKTSKWYTTEYKNLEVDIAHSVAGTRKSHSFYYLYYVLTGTGTSSKKGATGVGGIDFLGKGAEIAVPKVQEKLISILESEMEEIK